MGHQNTHLLQLVCWNLETYGGLKELPIPDYSNKLARMHTQDKKRRTVPLPVPSAAAFQ